MRTKHVEMIFVAGMALGIIGCATPREQDPLGTPVAAALVFPLGTLKIDLPSFRTLDELKAWSKPNNETERLYLFEKGEAKVAVVVATWGSGDHWKAVFVYAYDQLRGQWTARSLWNTEASNIRVIFNKRQGTVDVRSGRDVR